MKKQKKPLQQRVAHYQLHLLEEKWVTNTWLTLPLSAELALFLEEAFRAQSRSCREAVA